MTLSLAQLREKTIATLEEASAVNSLFSPIDENAAKSAPSTEKYSDFLHAAAKQMQERLTNPAGNDDAAHTELQATLTSCSTMQSHIVDGCRLVGELRRQYNDVADKTATLHHATDEAMAQQASLATLACDLRTKLVYFEHYEPIMTKLTTRLNVTSEAFMHILTTIDQCMAFHAEHPDYKESPVYLEKYRQCLSRALSLVKSYVTERLSHATNEIHERVQSDSGEDAFTLYYGLFATHAPSIRQLMGVIEQRASLAQEYAVCIEDCVSAYVSTRDSLICPSVTATIQQLIATHDRATCTMMRAGCSTLLRVCEDEHRLYYQFFTRSSPLMTDLTERLCRLLYDNTRGRLIHIAHMETISELCTIIRQEMLIDRCAIADDDNEQDGQYAGFARVAHEMSGDLVERLVHRSSIYARDDIGGYKPAAGDLAYPQKLHMIREIQQSQQGTNAPSGQSAVDTHALWYPTVRRVVLCLSKIYKCLDETVFAGVSQDVLSIGVESLVEASKLIAADPKKTLDAHLFLVKHLLILREQTVPFRVHGNVTDTVVDFTKIKDSASKLMTDKSRWFSPSSNNSVLEFLVQVPVHVHETTTDTRRIVDVHLRQACQALIVHCHSTVTHSIADFVAQADMFVESAKQSTPAANAAPICLADQTFAKPSAVHDLIQQSQRLLKEKLVVWKEALHLYIANAETELILFTPIKKRIMETYAQLRFVINQQYNDEERMIVGCPSTQQLNMIFA